MPKMVDTRYTQDRELSWLRFDERVLEEARDEDVPLMAVSYTHLTLPTTPYV